MKFGYFGWNILKTMCKMLHVVYVLVVAVAHTKKSA